MAELQLRNPVELQWGPRSVSPLAPDRLPLGMVSLWIPFGDGLFPASNPAGSCPQQTLPATGTLSAWVPTWMATAVVYRTTQGKREMGGWGCGAEQGPCPLPTRLPWLG